MVSPLLSEDEIFLSVQNSWQEWKADHWRSWSPTDHATVTVKRLFAIVYASTWKGTVAERMQHLLRLFPLAVEQAAKHPAFSSARTTPWTILRSPEGLSQLAGGVFATDDRDRIRQYSEQIVRLRLPEATYLLVRGEAAVREISVSTFVAGLIEDWAATQP